jgi:hypothetical protein
MGYNYELETEIINHRRTSARFWRATRQNDKLRGALDKAQRENRRQFNDMADELSDLSFKVIELTRQLGRCEEVLLREALQARAYAETLKRIQAGTVPPEHAVDDARERLAAAQKDTAHVDALRARLAERVRNEPKPAHVQDEEDRLRARRRKAMGRTPMPPDLPSMAPKVPPAGAAPKKHGWLYRVLFGW